MINPIHIKRRGLMLVLSSPSGAGKTTISRQLLKSDKNLMLSVSLTTRKRRPGEVTGRDYKFCSVEEFNKQAEDKKLLEYAKVFDNYYGTPREPVEKALEEGKDVLFDIDWQGTQQLGQVARGDLVTVFILPPTWDELKRRLMLRAQDSQQVVEKRMSKAADEMSHWAEYDYVIINYNFDHSVKQVEAILESERLKRQRQFGLAEFVKGLRQKI
ncbi:guanylate kinase [Candidatus Nucleicultrix amoebiphila]|jgi:guanylate kinase|uniref:Guanylate kinase n=1 Tax=Candidatus Nucleicultrix amoebiphila FS5 TaxID=1414854 RepID=A0A1W6N3T3_9PROT|nr:guanylate kinase [Candidatus Nucleicultrix amoebiphila]ARN84439.1 guanylate kinase [Candidatus Nucleicultrix amoebiphila FS5]